MVAIGSVGGLASNLFTYRKPEATATVPSTQGFQQAGTGWDVNRDGPAPDPEMDAKFFATRAHSVIRKDGEILAIQWKDGTTEIRKPSARGWNKESLINQYENSGLSSSQINDIYAKDLAKSFGAGVSIEKYEGRDDAPTRREMMRGMYAPSALGQRLSLTA